MVKDQGQVKVVVLIPTIRHLKNRDNLLFALVLLEI